MGWGVNQDTDRHWRHHLTVVGHSMMLGATEKAALAGAASTMGAGQ